MQYIQTASGAVLNRPSSAKVTSDETLVGLIAKGDRDAMRVLFARHNVRVFRFLMRIVGNEATAEDLVNEVFLDVLAPRRPVRGAVASDDLAVGDCAL